MVSLIFGDNSFEISRYIKKLKQESGLEPEVLDGAEVRSRDLADIFAGTSLFSESRFVVIYGLLENSEASGDLAKWLEQSSSDISVVLVETKVDKRTAIFKQLKAAGVIKEFAAWGDRDTAKAIAWVQQEAKNVELDLDRSLAQDVIQKVGVDQWALWNAVQLLSLADEVNKKTIEELLPSRSTENVFNLFETALSGDKQKLRSVIDSLSSTEDPYRVMALLISQLFNLVALAHAGGDANKVAADLGVHPYGLSKMSKFVRELNSNKIQSMIQAFAAADKSIKSTAHDPWTLIEQSLQKVATS